MIIRETDTPRNVWPLARVTKVFPDEQNLVRKVELCKAESNLDCKGRRMKRFFYNSSYTKASSALFTR